MISDDLRQAILSAMIKGDLVHNDPDESAVDIKQHLSVEDDG